MSQLVPFDISALPAVSVPTELAAAIGAQFAAAAANHTGGINRLSWRGKIFYLNSGGTEVELPDRVLDVHVVAVNPQPHYVFYERPYDPTSKDSDGAVLSRYPLADDPIEFTPSAEWASRVYKQRVVFMLANDPEHNLYIADLGYNSLRRTGDLRQGLMNFGQLLRQLSYYNKENPAVLPLMFTVQMSFTKATVDELQFSLTDQRARDGAVRFADADAVRAAVEALTDGTAEKLLSIEYDSRKADDGGAAAPEPAAPADDRQAARAANGGASAGAAFAKAAAVKEGRAPFDDDDELASL